MQPISKSPNSALPTSPAINQQIPSLIFWHINSRAAFTQKSLKILNSYRISEKSPLHHFRVYFAKHSLLPETHQDSIDSSGTDLLLYHSRDSLFCDIVIFCMKAIFHYGQCHVILAGDLGWDVLANRLRKEGVDVTVLGARDLGYDEFIGVGEGADGQRRASFSPQIIKISHGGKTSADLEANPTTPQRATTLSASDINFSAYAQLSPVRSPVMEQQQQHTKPNKEPASTRPENESTKPVTQTTASQQQQRSLPSSHRNSPQSFTPSPEHRTIQSPSSQSSDVSINWKEWGKDSQADIEKLRVMMSGKKMMPIAELLDFCCSVYEVPDEVCNKTLRHLLLTTRKVFQVDEAHGEIFVSLRQEFDIDGGTDDYSVKSGEDPDIIKSQQSRNQTEEQLLALKMMFANLMGGARADEDDDQSDELNHEQDTTVVDAPTTMLTSQTNMTPPPNHTSQSSPEHFPTPNLRKLQREDLSLIQQIVQKDESHEMELEELKEELEAQGINATNLELFLIPYSNCFSVQQTLTSCIVSLLKK